MVVFSPTKDFDFDKITLANPHPVQGGSYFTTLNMDNKPLNVQLPECYTKQGIVSTQKGKYCDLMYDTNYADTLTEWIEALELKCQNLIHDKKSLWFHNDITKDDITSMMSPVCRLYKSGKKILIRTNITNHKRSGKVKCIIYNENQEPLESSDILSEHNIIPLICIDGIRFTSRSFEISIVLTQIMMLESTPEEEVCLITNHATVKKSLALNKPVQPVANRPMVLHTQDTDIASSFVADDSVNTDDNVSAQDNINADNSVNASADDSARTDDNASADDSVNASADDSARADDNASASDNASADDSTHADDNVSASDNASADDSAHADDNTSASDNASAEDSVNSNDNIDNVMDTSIREITTAAEINADTLANLETTAVETTAVETTQGASTENIAENTTAENTTAENTTAENTTAENTTAENTTAENTTAENTLEDLYEVDISLPDSSETIQLRKPNEVYYEIYRSALKKAKHMRNVALDAYLEAKNIKERYMLEEIDEDSEIEEFSQQNDLG